MSRYVYTHALKHLVGASHLFQACLIYSQYAVPPSILGLPYCQLRLELLNTVIKNNRGIVTVLLVKQVKKNIQRYQLWCIAIKSEQLQKPFCCCGLDAVIPLNSRSAPTAIKPQSATLSIPTLPFKIQQYLSNCLNLCLLQQLIISCLKPSPFISHLFDKFSERWIYSANVTALKKRGSLIFAHVHYNYLLVVKIRHISSSASLAIKWMGWMTNWIHRLNCRVLDGWVSIQIGYMRALTQRWTVNESCDFIHDVFTAGSDVTSEQMIFNFLRKVPTAGARLSEHKYVSGLYNVVCCWQI